MTREAGRTRARRIVTLLTALLMFLLPMAAWAQAGAGPAVRKGTTSVLPAEAAVTKLKQRPPAAAEAPPSDAPHVADETKVPKPPASFNTHDAGWIRFSYLPAVRERVQPLIDEADSVKRQLTERLGVEVLSDVTVYVARTPGEMASLAPEGAPFPKYAAGVAYSNLRFVLLTIHPVHPNSRHELSEVFRHELAHVALHEAVKGRHVPRWFNEGFAVFASGESSFPRMQTLWTATLSNDLLPLKRMERSFPEDAQTASVAYAEAADVVRFLVRKQDKERFTAMIDRIQGGQGFEPAMRDSYGVDLAGLEYEWREDVARRYTFWPVLFSGSFIWAFAIGLFAWGFRRRKKRDKVTLARWSREEAREEELRRRIAEAAQDGRVHIVLSRGGKEEPSQELMPPVGTEAPVPKVEHDGQWHTLH
ncbi:MAG TPA: peptidase MA family metallohydrolase [Polyangiaceae bacterium]|nr:peptidase MA family metallohydrolase [Polyangiaceae bacterium]